jgi:hypothetical protein
MDGACSTNGENRNACRLMVGKQEGNRPLGRPRPRWMDDIISWRNRMAGLDWIGLVQDRQVESSCECGNEPSGFMKCWETIEWLHNWGPLE